MRIEPILFADGSKESTKAKRLLKKARIEFNEYDGSKLAEACCGPSALKPPALIAREGIFEGLAEIELYASFTRASTVQEHKSDKLP